jgi:lysosomal acid lipase/cholesteryl ester hydrolase
MFGLLATRPEYNDKIKPFVAMAPVAFVGHVKSPIKYIAHSRLLYEFLEKRGGAFFPTSMFNRVLTDHFCPMSSFKYICSNVVFLLTGFNQEQLNSTRLPVYFANTPAGSSTKNILHYAQGVISKRFAKYNPEVYENKTLLERYSPPEYPLEKITSPYIALMSGLNDWLADPLDVEILRSKLRVKLLDDYIVPDDKWNHLDFIWGLDSGKFVNSRIIQLLTKF